MNSKLRKSNNEKKISLQNTPKTALSRRKRTIDSISSSEPVEDHKKQNGGDESPNSFYFCSSQITSTQDCEVFWDCNSPGFSKQDLKNYGNMASISTSSPVMPVPQRTLFHRLRPPEFLSSKSCGRDNNIEALASQLDDLLDKVNVDKSSKSSDAAKNSSREIENSSAEEKHFDGDENDSFLGDAFSNSLAEDADSAANSRSKTPKNPLLESLRPLRSDNRKASANHCDRATTVSKRAKMGDSAKKSDKSPLSASFSDDDLFSDSFLQASQALENAFYDKQKTEFTSPAHCRLSNADSPLSRSKKKKSIFNGNVASLKFHAPNSNLTSLLKPEANKNYQKHSDQSKINTTKKLPVSNDLPGKLTNFHKQEKKSNFRFQRHSNKSTRPIQIDSQKTFNTHKTQRFENPKPSINNNSKSKIDGKFDNDLKPRSQIVTLSSKSKSENFCTNSSRFKRSLSSDFYKENANNAQLDEDDDDKFLLDILPQLDEIEAQHSQMISLNTGSLDSPKNDLKKLPKLSSTPKNILNKQSRTQRSTLFPDSNAKAINFPESPNNVQSLSTKTTQQVNSNESNDHNNGKKKYVESKVGIENAFKKSKASLSTKSTKLNNEIADINLKSSNPIEAPSAGNLNLIRSQSPPFRKKPGLSSGVGTDRTQSVGEISCPAGDSLKENRRKGCDLYQALFPDSNASRSRVSRTIGAKNSQETSKVTENQYNSSCSLSKKPLTAANASKGPVKSNHPTVASSGNSSDKGFSMLSTPHNNENGPRNPNFNQNKNITSKGDGINFSNPSTFSQKAKETNKSYVKDNYNTANTSGAYKTYNLRSRFTPNKNDNLHSNVLKHELRKVSSATEKINQLLTGNKNFKIPSPPRRLENGFSGVKRTSSLDNIESEHDTSFDDGLDEVFKTMDSNF